MHFISRTIFILTSLSQVHVRSEVISGKYKITQVTETDYGSVMESFYASGITKCFLECQRNSECQSVLYNKVSLQCTTNNVAVLPSTLITFDDPDAPRYHYVGKGVVLATMSTIGNHCYSNDQCEDLNSECRDDICKCYYGYAHDSTNNSCVTFCDVYGSTFQVELERAIDGYNDDTIYNTTAINCEAKCLEATTFTCRSYEFDYRLNTCYLQNATSIHVPSDAHWNGTNYILYTRDCAYSPDASQC